MQPMTPSSSTDQPELTLVLKTPSPDAPGYIDRLERALEFKEAIDSKQMSPKIVRDMINFLADYIPGDRETVIKALRQASENEFKAMFAAVSGESANVPPGN